MTNREASAASGPLAPVAAVGVVCLRGDDVLLIRRGKPPLLGAWSLPGGRIEWGETARDAALRELKEETGVEAELVSLIDVVDGLFPTDTTPAQHYVLIDFAARWRAGAPQPGDDAADASFFAPTELAGLGLWDETIRIIKMAQKLAGEAN